MRPLLSICIPTRNSCRALKITIDAWFDEIARADVSEVEIVISDNNSTDDTQTILMDLKSKYSDALNLRLKNENNFDKNFIDVLKQARGAYLKLWADNFIPRPGYLTQLLQLVDLCREDRRDIIFLNKVSSNEPVLNRCRNLDELINAVSFNITWNLSFGIWADDVHKFDDESEHTPSMQLLIPSMTLSRLQCSGEILIYKNFFTEPSVRIRKPGYDLGDVFIKNYLSLLSRYVEQSELSPGIFQEEKRRVLIEHVLPNHNSRDHGFFSYPLLRHIQAHYSSDAYALEAYNFYRSVDYSIKNPRVIEQFGEIDSVEKLKYLWRSLNSHNATVMSEPFNPSIVHVGVATYGDLHVKSWGQPGEALSIGHYVSIADNVRFLLGGNHSYASFSTYPFRVNWFGATVEATSKGQICVRDDVWIGHDVVVLSGVTLGRGSVIGAGSVVARDVPPYAIVVGNPARIIRYRFDPEVVDALMEIDYANLSPETHARLGEDFFCRSVDAGNVSDVIRHISSR